MTPRTRTTCVFVVSGVLLVSAALWAVSMLRTATTHEAQVGDPSDYGPLSSTQYAAAVAIARREVEQQGGRLTSATAVLRSGRVRQPNLAGRCTSGREIRILLIGRFRHIVVDPPPGAPDGPVTSVGIVADAATGRACLLGVGNTAARPYRRSADLMPALDADR